MSNIIRSVASRRDRPPHVQKQRTGLAYACQNPSIFLKLFLSMRPGLRGMRTILAQNAAAICGPGLELRGMRTHGMDAIA
jgi:hypothetical protein